MPIYADNFNTVSPSTLVLFKATPLYTKALVPSTLLHLTETCS
jgi:hypothetical protein